MLSSWLPCVVVATILCIVSRCAESRALFMSMRQVYFYSVDEDFALLRSFAMPISFAEEGGASLHPTENKFVAGGSDTWVRVFDFESGELLETLKGHHGPVRCLRYSPSGDSFATGSEDGTIRIWQNDSTLAALTSIADTASSLS